MAEAQAQSAPAGDAATTTAIHVGTRKSPLAIAQADIAVKLLQAQHPSLTFQVHGVSTTADHDQNTALYNFGGKGLWTEQLEQKLVSGELDLVVHSLKDVPTSLPEGCELAGGYARADPRDVLVIKPTLRSEHGWKTLADLPAGSVVGTSSIRRIAQLRRRYPALRFKDHRGNIHTRLRKLNEDDELTAIILAAAGLQRMGMDDHIAQYLESDTGGIMYAVGQGALGIETRKGDKRILDLLKGMEDKDTMLAITAERSIMRTLEGGCSVPIGVESRWLEEDGKKLGLRAIVVSVDGQQAVEAEMAESVTTLEGAEEFGQKVALDLVRRGADKILDNINAAKPMPGTT